MQAFLHTLQMQLILGAAGLESQLLPGIPTVVLEQEHYYLLIKNEQGQIFAAESLGLPDHMIEKNLKTPIYAFADTYYQYVDPTGQSTNTCGLYVAHVCHHIAQHPRDAWDAWSAAFAGLPIQGIPRATSVPEWIQSQTEHSAQLQINDTNMIRYASIMYPELISRSMTVDTVNPIPSTTHTKDPGFEEVLTQNTSAPPPLEPVPEDEVPPVGGRAGLNLTGEGNNGLNLSGGAASQETIEKLWDHLKAPHTRTALLLGLDPRAALKFIRTRTNKELYEPTRQFLPSSFWNSLVAVAPAKEKQTYKTLAEAAQDLPKFTATDKEHDLLDKVMKRHIHPAQNLTLIKRLIAKLPQDESILLYSSLSQKQREHLPKLPIVAWKAKEHFPTWQSLQKHLKPHQLLALPINVRKHLDRAILPKSDATHLLLQQIARRIDKTTQAVEHQLESDNEEMA